MRVVPSVAGPEAELARLARPTGPWIHLLDAAPADARQLGWLLGQDGVVVRQLRGHCGRSAYGLLDEIGAALQLPGDPADDWAGLAGLLTDMAWLPGSGHVLVVTRAGLLLAAEPLTSLRGLVDAVREVARARAEEGDPLPFHLVLQDDTLGLAALRARLDAVGARYAELSGWDAEEPSVAAPPSARSSLAGGPVDEVDLAAGPAASTVDGVRSLGRAWEEFRGGSAGPVRVYVPVLAGPADLAAVVAAVAGAVAAAGASCVVVPVPAEAALADARQRAVASVATEVWPHPAPPEDAAPDELAAAEPAVVEPAVVDPAVVEPAAVEPAVEPAPAGPGAPATSAGPAAEPTPAAPAAGPALVEPVAAPTPAVPVATESAAAAPGPAIEPVADPSPTIEIPATRAVPDSPPTVEIPAAGPHDRPGAPFELIAANLQWPFDVGPGDDPVDGALRAHAERSSRTAALFRTWVQDPDGSWVRVVLGYVSRTSIADVEAERTALVDVLQAAGAARCCVEVLAAADVSDAHRWLEARCRPLWPTPEPAAEPAPAAEPTPEQTAAPAPVPAAASETAAGTAAVTATDRAPDDGTAQHEDETAGVGLPADATFTPGPAADDPAHAATLGPLIEWATGHEGVVGLVTAYTGDRLVIGIALDGTADPDRVRAEAPAAVEPFAPSRGLDPVHLRLTRSSTRIWTRRSERAQPQPAAPATGTLERPPPPVVQALGPPPVRDTDDPRGDTVVDGFTLVGIDRDTAVGKGAPEPDAHDAALVEWARTRPGAIALLRGVTDEGLTVYCLAVEESFDPEAARRELATAAGAAGLSRAALEAFAPAATISAFHLDLAVGSTRLWPTPA